MNFTADIVRVMGLTPEEAELFLQKYGDWEVEILGKTVRGITPERLLSVGKCATEEERVGGPGDARWREWASKKGETHDQERCPDCGLYKIWKPKAIPQPEEELQRSTIPISPTRKDDGPSGPRREVNDYA